MDDLLIKILITCRQITKDRSPKSAAHLPMGNGDLGSVQHGMTMQREANYSQMKSSGGLVCDLRDTVDFCGGKVGLAQHIQLSGDLDIAVNGAGGSL